MGCVERSRCIEQKFSISSHPNTHVSYAVLCTDLIFEWKLLVASFDLLARRQEAAENIRKIIRSTNEHVKQYLQSERKGERKKGMSVNWCWTSIADDEWRLRIKLFWLVLDHISLLLLKNRSIETNTSLWWNDSSSVNSAFDAYCHESWKLSALMWNQYHRDI